MEAVLKAAFSQEDDQLTADLCLEVAFLEAAMEAVFENQLEVYFAASGGCLGFGGCSLATTGGCLLSG